jgi:hypothetical protein
MLKGSNKFATAPRICLNMEELSGGITLAQPQNP